jgi:predicted RND superfamily exporter protein
VLKFIEWFKESPFRAILISSGTIVLIAVLIFKLGTFYSESQQEQKISYDKNLGNNSEAAVTAKNFMDIWNKLGKSSKWHIDLQPSEGARDVVEYRKQVTDVVVVVELVGNGVENWNARKDRMSQIYPGELDQEIFVKDMIKKLRGEDYSGSKSNSEGDGYINAGIVVKIRIGDKVVAEGKYNAENEKIKVELL